MHRGLSDLLDSDQKSLIPVETKISSATRGKARITDPALALRHPYHGCRTRIFTSSIILTYRLPRDLPRCSVQLREDEDEQTEGYVTSWVHQWICAVDSCRSSLATTTMALLADAALSTCMCHQKFSVGAISFDEYLLRLRPCARACLRPAMTLGTVRLLT